MSRSKREPWVIDGARKPRAKHYAKKKAARVARRSENTNLKLLGENYVAQPSKAYTDPYSISDHRYPTNDLTYSRK